MQFTFFCIVKTVLINLYWSAQLCTVYTLMQWLHKSNVFLFFFQFNLDCFYVLNNNVKLTNYIHSFICSIKLELFLRDDTLTQTYTYILSWFCPIQNKQFFIFYSCMLNLHPYAQFKLFCRVYTAPYSQQSYAKCTLMCTVWTVLSHVKQFTYCFFFTYILICTI